MRHSNNFRTELLRKAILSLLQRISRLNGEQRSFMYGGMIEAIHNRMMSDIDKMAQSFPIDEDGIGSIQCHIAMDTRDIFGMCTLEMPTIIELERFADGEILASYNDSDAGVPLATLSTDEVYIIHEWLYKWWKRK